MQRNRLQPAWVVPALLLLATGGAQAQTEVVFIPATAALPYAARAYREIWDENGERIVAALEARTCLPFPETSVTAMVDDAVSHSGGPDRPMRLRASYMLDVKKSTLVHELGHRHLWQLAARLDDIDGHMTLYLVLDRVWADVWGENFADERVAGEANWGADYAAAWDWARSLSSEQRTRLWKPAPGHEQLFRPAANSTRGGVRRADAQGTGPQSTRLFHASPCPGVPSTHAHHARRSRPAPVRWRAAGLLPRRGGSRPRGTRTYWFVREAARLPRRCAAPRSRSWPWAAISTCPGPAR